MGTLDFNLPWRKAMGKSLDFLVIGFQGEITKTLKSEKPKFGIISVLYELGKVKQVQNVSVCFLMFTIEIIGTLWKSCFVNEEEITYQVPYTISTLNKC